jgi:cystathionine beta-lyase/cystathionine gamma-synthase
MRDIAAVPPMPWYGGPGERADEAVVHSARPFLYGRGEDCAAGVVCASTALIDEVRTKMRSWGGHPHPAAVERLARGLTALSVRVTTPNATATAVAVAVAQWAAAKAMTDGPVRALYDLGLAPHPDRAVATECDSGHGHLIAIARRGGDAAVGTVHGRMQRLRVQRLRVQRLRVQRLRVQRLRVQRLRVQRLRVQRADSAARLGGVESVASPLAVGSTRLSIGLDEASTLIDDLTQALE